MMQTTASTNAIELGQAIGIGIGAVSAALSAIVLVVTRALKGTADLTSQTVDQVNCAVNQTAPGEGIKDRLERVEISLAAAATVNADHQAQTNRQFDSLHESMAEINQVVAHVAQRLIVVEDDHVKAAYIGVERRAKPAAARKTASKKASG